MDKAQREEQGAQRKPGSWHKDECHSPQSMMSLAPPDSGPFDKYWPVGSSWTATGSTCGTDTGIRAFERGETRFEGKDRDTL